MLLPDEDMTKIKSAIIDFMTQLPPNLQVQIGEAVSIIADSDFPDRWMDLIPTLVSKLSEDPSSNNGVLTVAHSIFSRWRPLFRTDQLFLEIKLALDQFAPTFLKLLQMIDTQIESHPNDKKFLTEALKSMDLMMAIFYDFNCQDLPEFFEDNLNPLFEVVHKYLIYKNPLFEDPDDDEAGPLEHLRTSICELLQLYTFRYEEVFAPLLPKFVETTWNLLTTTGPQSKYEILISKALSFLTYVAKVPRHAQMFASEEALEQIIRNVILPNITLQESDEEMFEDDPIEFTRRDLEGSDSDTRRRAATDFLRELNNQNQNTVTQVVLKYINEFLAAYKSNPEANWKQKDTAIYLFSAIAVKGTITNEGVTSVNEQVDIINFFTENIASDLTSTSGNPILVVDSIKYLYVFRRQLTKDQFMVAFNYLDRHLEANEYVVYTYAAITIEKVLGIRSISDKNSYLFDKTDVSPMAEKWLSNLFKIISRQQTPEKVAENEFLMKCILRILTCCKEACLPYAAVLLQQLVEIIKVISKNPSNPKFSHYTFESIGALIRYCASSLGASTIEPIIFPTFLEILANDVSEFVPYTFQILAYLLEFYPSNQQLSENYTQLIRPLMSPALWELRGNVSSLTKLLQSILRHGSDIVVSSDNLTPYLGIFQKLISMKFSETYGLDLLEDLFYNIKASDIAPYTNQIAVLLLQRLQTKTDKLVIRTASFIYSMAASTDKTGLGPENVIQLFEKVQEGIFDRIFQLFLPATPKIVGIRNQRVALVGLTNLISKTTYYSTGTKNETIKLAVQALVQVLNSETMLKNPNEDINEDLETKTFDDEVSFGSSFSQLSIVSIPSVNPLSGVTNVKDYVFTGLRSIGSILQIALDEESKQALQKTGFA